MNFLEHSDFPKDLKPIAKRHNGVDKGMATLRLLLAQQFNPINKIEAIGPSKINRVLETATWEIWKVEMAIPGSGLRPSQWPRVWFIVSGDNIAFLTAAMHGDNYSDNDLKAIAKARATDIF